MGLDHEPPRVVNTNSVGQGLFGFCGENLEGGPNMVILMAWIVDLEGRVEVAFDAKATDGTHAVPDAAEVDKNAGAC